MEGTSFPDASDTVCRGDALSKKPAMLDRSIQDEACASGSVLLKEIAMRQKSTSKTPGPVKGTDQTSQRAATGAPATTKGGSDASTPGGNGFDVGMFLADSTAAVNEALDRFLPKASVKPATMHKAMRYSLFAGGKRMRPALCLAAAQACGGTFESAMPLACAVECIHTYSLVHDDLPAMDNDDYRRGKLTSHKVFGEGIAVLAGDALLTQAFEIAAQCDGWKRYTHQDIVLEIAKASGSLQLIAGQVADLEGEGKSLSASQLRYIHERKTSALLCCSVRLGGMSANCSPAELEALTRFGYNVGLAFQVIDDILDVTQTSEKLGKTAGKDIKAGKATYPAIVGLERSRKIAEKLTSEAFAALKPFKGRAGALNGLAQFLLQRDR